MPPKIIIIGVRCDNYWAPRHGIIPQGATITFKHMLELSFAPVDVIATLAPVWEIEHPSGHMFMDSL